LAALRAGAEEGLIGDPFLKGRAFSRRTDQDIAADFGAAFAEGLARAPIGIWFGPIGSSYGEHLVRVEERAPGGVLPLSAVRARLRDDALGARRAAEAREATRKLRDHYRLEVEEAP